MSTGVWKEVVVELPRFQYNPNRPGLRRWLYTLVQSKATNLIRERTRHQVASLSDVTEAGWDPLDPRADPADEYERHWKQELVRTVLAELRKHVPEKSYLVLHMRHIEGRSVPEVAQALDLTRRQVSFRLQRAQNKFRALFNVFTGNQFDVVMSRQATEITSEILSSHTKAQPKPATT